MCVSICYEHLPSTLGANRNVSTRIWLLWDVFFMFAGAFESEVVPRMCLAGGPFQRHFECDVEVTSRLEVGWALVGGLLGVGWGLVGGL